MMWAWGHASYGLSVVIVFIGFLLSGNFPTGIFCLVAGGLWGASTKFYPRQWLFNSGIILLMMMLFLAGLSHVMVWMLLLALVLALIGDELLRFQFRYQNLDVPPTMTVSHLVQTLTVGLAALVLSGLALLFQLSLAFWPVLGLGALALLAIIILLRRLRKTSENQ